MFNHLPPRVRDALVHVGKELKSGSKEDACFPRGAVTAIWEADFACTAVPGRAARVRSRAGLGRRHGQKRAAVQSPGFPVPSARGNSPRAASETGGRKGALRGGRASRGAPAPRGQRACLCHGSCGTRRKVRACARGLCPPCPALPGPAVQALFLLRPLLQRFMCDILF